MNHRLTLGIPLNDMHFNPVSLMIYRQLRLSSHPQRLLLPSVLRRMCPLHTCMVFRSSSDHLASMKDLLNSPLRFARDLPLLSRRNRIARKDCRAS